MQMTKMQQRLVPHGLQQELMMTLGEMLTWWGRHVQLLQMMMMETPIWSDPLDRQVGCFAVG
jgi:hypothetical protein